MSKINILQISDLHRGMVGRIGNAALLDSLLTDIEYSLKKIPSIDIVIVCGDLVQGIKATNIEAAEQLYSQYEEAEDFLSNLCTKVVGGCRDRIVIIPGNHDISWPHSHCSMLPNELDLRSEERRSFIQILVKESLTPISKNRWSWNDLQFMEIHNDSLYSERLAPFCNFYDSFYQGTRTYSQIPKDQFAVHDYKDLGVIVLGMNSCDCLDHCNLTARFNPDAMAKAFTQLRSHHNSTRIKIAVWHHGIVGSPQQTDYLDSLTVQNFIVNRFSLGLHGHQHISDFMTELGKFGYDSRMLMIGTGTLCGTAETLPPGQMRGYNIITLEPDSGELWLYPREMKQSSFESPVWGPKYLPYTTDYPIHANIGQTVQQWDREGKFSIETDRSIAEAERLIGNSEYEDAIHILEDIDTTDEIARRLKVGCYFNLHRNENLIELCRNPISTLEAIYVLNAADNIDDHSLIAELLGNPLIAHSDDPSLVELRHKLQRRRKND